MEWARPGIGRHFDFHGVDEKGRKRYAIILQVTNMDPEHKIAAIHIPFQQEGWSIDEPEQAFLDATIEGLTITEGGNRWQCVTDLGESIGTKRGLVFHSGDDSEGKWEGYLEFGHSAMITCEALIISDEPLADQSLTLQYLPALSWNPHRHIPKHWVPELRWSPPYSTNAEIDEMALA